MALPDVSPDALEDHYEGDLTKFSQKFVAGRLNEVVDKIESRWGARVESRIRTGALKERLYVATVCRLATRVLRNPEGFRREAEGSYSYDLSAAVASGTIWFTDDDIEDLTGTNPKQSRVIGTATTPRHRPGWVS